MAQYQFPALMALSNLQQRRYVLELAVRGFEKPGEAAKAAGYRSGVRAVERLNKNQKVQAAIKEQQQAAEKAVEKEFGPARDAIVREIAALAFNSIGDLVSFNHRTLTLTPSKELRRETLAAISKIKQGSHGVELAMYDKGANLERLAKILGYMQPDAPAGGVTLVIGDPDATVKRLDKA